MARSRIAAFIAFSMMGFALAGCSSSGISTAGAQTTPSIPSVVAATTSPPLAASPSTSTVTATPSPRITARPTPKPTPRPTPKPTPRPTAKPAPTGVYGNPWGYDFIPGNLIYSPPSTFCDYFNCIASFWTSTNGYVEQCVDLTFSHSGGRSGSCSHHGGNYRPLYSH